jgi:hypothetical protein
LLYLLYQDLEVFHQILGKGKLKRMSVGVGTGDTKVKEYIHQYAMCLWLLQLA